ncbi:type IV pilin-like G/H family protein [Ancylothrix sp. C2]|uniref:type IV pilin-like G/H family protein n=1 Tax=Ancylothrix sp. D3o TaxID=2953691 RepID=UPI0021BA7378|nr:type IV pilin-like G/H family protein [Ancylothrix sp. D3o]MCT7949373.1 type IV pilin-like G/H family protein [Ancylothrix sp. D3o]
MKFNLSFVKIFMVCGAGVLSIVATCNRLQAQNNRPGVKEVSSNKMPLTSQHLTQADVDYQTIQARQTEAINHIALMSRAQLYSFIDHKRFASKLNDLDLEIKPESENYYYSMRALSPTLIQNIGVPKRDNLKSYTGIIYVFQSKENNETVIGEVRCESRRPSKAAPPPPQMKGNEPQCPAGFNNLR